MSRRGPLLVTACLLFGLVAILQTVVAPRMALFQVKPDLMLLAVLIWTLICGSREGLVVAFFGGVWLDLFSGGIMGVSSLALMVAALVAGFGHHTLFRRNLLVPMAATLLGSLSYALVYLGISSLFGLIVPLGATMSRLVVPAIFYNSVLMLCFTPLLNRIPEVRTVS